MEKIHQSKIYDSTKTDLRRQHYSEQHGSNKYQCRNIKGYTDMSVGLSLQWPRSKDMDSTNCLNETSERILTDSITAFLVT